MTMKVINNPQLIIRALQKARKVYGEENVRVGINTILGFSHVYGNLAHDVFVDGQYLLIVPKGAADYLFDADVVFDMEVGRVIIDRKDLFSDQCEEAPVLAVAGR